MRLPRCCHSHERSLSLTEGPDLDPGCHLEPGHDPDPCEPNRALALTLLLAPTLPRCS